MDLTVSDMQRSLLFYEKVLGFLGFRRVAHESYIALSNGHMGIGFRPVAPEEKDLSFNRYRVGLHPLALRAKSRKDVDELYQFLLREGITILDPPAEYPQYGPNYGLLSAGDHTLEIQIDDLTGATAHLAHAVSVVKPGGFEFLDLFDLSGAAAQIEGEEIVLTDVVVRDQTTQQTKVIDVNLRWFEHAQALGIVAARE